MHFQFRLTNCGLLAFEKRLETSPLRLSVAFLGAAFSDTKGRGAPLFPAPKGDVPAAFVTHLICDIIFGSGGNLFYSPGTDKTWLHIKVYFLISRGGRREQNPLATTSRDKWRRLDSRLGPRGRARSSLLLCRRPRVSLTRVPATFHRPGPPPTSLPRSFLGEQAAFRTSFQRHHLKKTKQNKNDFSIPKSSAFFFPL